jgi:hypothetical protein
MRGTKVIAMIVGALVLSMGLARADAGKWEVKDKTSALDGTHEYSADLEADAPVANLLGRPEKASIGLLCNHNGLALVINWPDFIDKDYDQDEVILTWKLDDGAVQRSSWPAVSDGLVVQGKAALEWARKWSVGKVLVIRVPDKHGGQEATLQIAGLDQIVANVTLNGCPSTH